jgi:hypothetical protein
MRLGKVIVSLVMVVVVGGGAVAQTTVPAPLSRVVRQQVSWSSLPGRIVGKTVYVGLADASVATGKVSAVTFNHVILEPRPDNPAPDAVALRREQVKFIQFDVVEGKARRRWTIALLFAGLGASLLLADRAVAGDNYLHFAAAMTAGGAAAGYAIGAVRDWKTYILTVAP